MRRQPRSYIIAASLHPGARTTLQPTYSRSTRPSADIAKNQIATTLVIGQTTLGLYERTKKLKRATLAGIRYGQPIYSSDRDCELEDKLAERTQFFLDFATQRKTEGQEPARPQVFPRLTSQLSNSTCQIRGPQNPRRAKARQP